MEGIIFKIKRNRLKLNISDVENKSGVHATTISRFENMKINISDEKIDMLFNAIGEDVQVNEIQEQELLKYVKSLYLDFIQGNEYKYTFDQYTNFDWKYVRTNSYFVYLIGMLIYQYEDIFENNILSFRNALEILERYKEYIPVSYLTIYYMMSGLYSVKQNKMDRVLSDFGNAKLSAFDDISNAFALYQLGIYHSKFGDLVKALNYFIKSKNLFDVDFYLKNSMNNSIEIGKVYLKLGLYTNAESILHSCIKLNYNYHIDDSKFLEIYKLIMYGCFSKRDYYAVLEFNQMLKEKNIENIYFSLSNGIAYYYLNELEKAKKQLKIAQKNKDNEYFTDEDKIMIQAYNFVINGQTFEKYEKKFLAIYQYALKKMDLHLQIFILETLIEFAKKENETQKLIQYYSLLHDKYKERH